MPGDPAATTERTATVVVSDLAGSTSLGERLDPETLRSILGRYFDEMRAVLVAHGGRIEKIIGDAIVAVFEADEPGDAALAALRAVTEARTSLQSLNAVLEERWGVALTNRTGVATGPLRVRRLTDRHSVIGGPAVAAAESLERAAPHLGALVDRTTRDHAADRGRFDDHGTVPAGGAEVEGFVLLGIDPDEAAAGANASCASCGRPLPEGAAACASCGTSTGPARETRRVVTVVFVDPKPSSVRPDGDRPEQRAGAMSDFFDAVLPILERHGATVETFIGDAVMAVFGLPVRHEDDALRAVRAAHEFRQRLPSLNERLDRAWGVHMGCPIGVNTGEVVAGDAAAGQRLITGDTVNVAARLEQRAEPGEILIGDLTFRLVRDQVAATRVEPLVVRGKAEPVPAHRLDGLVAAASTAPRLPLVGRERELAGLLVTMDQAVTSRRCAMVTLVGDAGVGKTRLLEEFEARAAKAGAGLAKGRCLPYGDGITFWPIVEVVRSLAAVDDGDSRDRALEKVRALVEPGNEDVVERIASIVGLGGHSFPVSESFWAVRRLLEIVAGDDPLIVSFEDVHWAEPTFLDLVSHLVATSEGTPLVVLCSARPGLLDRVPDWATGAGERRVELVPLSDDDAARIVEHALGGAGIPRAAAERVVQAAQGNPLFVEQLVAMLVDEGVLERVGERWVTRGEPDALAIPPTIHALLAARIDRLGEGERAVVDPASVIGRVFAVDALRHLLDRDPAEGLGPRLEVLVARRVVDREREASFDGEAFRFTHLLLRDAAYAGLLKETRARLHESFVSWADAVNARSGRSTEFDEILGFHLEQAYRYRSELGPIDETAVAMGEDGSRRLAAAGRRAFARGDMPAAAGLLTRAAGLLADGHVDLPDLLLRAGEAHFETGAFDASAEAIERSAALADQARDAAAADTARVERLRVAYLTGSAGSSGEVAAEADALGARLEQAGHDPGLARLWRLRAMIDVVAARFGPAEEAALRMVDHAGRTGDEVLALRALPNIAAIAPVGPTPIPEAIRRCEEVLSRVQSDRRAAANTRRALASLHAMAGDFDTARNLYREARAALADLGWRHDAALVSHDSGPIELLADDPERAESELRAGYDALEAMGDRFFRPTTAVLLAEALYRLGRHDEAAAMARECADSADPDDLWPQVLWRATLARLDALRGSGDPVALAEEAVALSEGSDSPVLQADAQLALAEVADLTGDAGLAAEAAARALDRHHAKGSTAGSERVRRLVAHAPSPSA